MALTVTWVRLHVGPFVSLLVLLETSCREKHNDTKIIDLRSLDVDIFRINTLKMYFLRVSSSFCMWVMTWFCTNNYFLDEAFGRSRPTSYVCTSNKTGVLLLCLLQACRRGSQLRYENYEVWKLHNIWTPERSMCCDCRNATVPWNDTEWYAFNTAPY